MPQAILPDLASGPIKQICFIVPHPRAAARDHNRLYGAPFFVHERYRRTRNVNRGRGIAEQLDLSSVRSKFGSVMLRGVHHVALVAEDLDRALAFYREAFGFELLTEPFVASSRGFADVAGLAGAESRVAHLRARNIVIELFQYLTPPTAPSERPANRAGRAPIALDVTDIDEAYCRALAAGASFHVPPQDFGELKATYGRDPEGNLFELQQLVTPGHRWELDVLNDEAP